MSAPDVPIEQRLSALSCSAAAGQTAAAKELVANGVNVDGVDEAGRTPVMLAVLGGHLNTAVELALSGADLSRTDREGRTALELAILAQNREVRTPGK